MQERQNSLVSPGRALVNRGTMRRPSTKPIKGFQPPQVSCWLTECDITAVLNASKLLCSCLALPFYLVGIFCLRTFGGDAGSFKVMYAHDDSWQCRLSQGLSHPGEKAQGLAQGWLLPIALLHAVPLLHAVQQTVLPLGRSELPPPHSCQVL